MGKHSAPEDIQHLDIDALPAAIVEFMQGTDHYDDFAFGALRRRLYVRVHRPTPGTTPAFDVTHQTSWEGGHFERLHDVEVATTLGALLGAHLEQLGIDPQEVIPQPEGVNV